MQKCLQVCDQKEVTSIAFPALGAGALNYPANIVARVMIATAQNYCQMNTTTCIKVIKFVIFTPDTYKEFRSLLSPEFPNAATSTINPDMSVSSPLLSIPQNPVYHPTPSSLPSSPQSASPSEVYQTGNITVEIVCGDITDDDSDIIINTTLSDLQLASGTVSMAISQKAGPSMQQDCHTYIKQYKSLEEGKVCVTQATGLLKCKKVFHVVVPNKKKANSLSLTVTTCLKEAEFNKLRSIAFPAIGTGGLSIKPKLVAQGMCEAIIEFGVTQPVYLRQVKIVIFQTDMHQVFTEKFEELSKTQSGQPQPGFLHRISNYVSTVSSAVGSYFGGGKQFSDSSNNKVAMNHASHNLLSPPHITQPISFTNASDTPSQTVQIRIYAMDESAVSKTEEQLWSVINQNFTSISVNDSRISSLRQEHVLQLTQKANEYHISIEVETELRRIQLRGSKDEIQNVKGEIERVLFELAAEKLKSAYSAEAATLLLKTVTWQYQVNEKYDDYEAEINYKIEQAYQSYKKQNGSATYNFRDDDNTECQIIFNSNPMQEKILPRGPSTNVRRITIEDKIKDMLEKGWQ